MFKCYEPDPFSEVHYKLIAFPSQGGYTRLKEICHFAQIVS